MPVESYVGELVHWLVYVLTMSIAAPNLKAIILSHPNHLAVNLLRLPDNRRLRRFLPTDLPDRF
jgi:hypothetical protein